METSVDDKPVSGIADLAQVRAEVRDLRRAFAGGNPAAATRVRAVLPNAGTEINLANASW